MKKKTIVKITCSLLSLMLVLTFIPFSAFANNGKGIAAVTGSQQVRFVKDGGTGDGTTADKAMGDLGKAFTDLKTSGGVIVISGNYTLGKTATGKEIILPKGNAPVTVTSYYGGTDYRGNAKVITPTEGVARMFLGTAVTFDYIKFSFTASNFIFFACYNNLTIGKDFQETIVATSETSAHFPIIASGTDKGLHTTVPEIAFDAFSGTQTTTINAGQWNYVRGGDRRSDASALYTNVTGTMNVVINDGKFMANGTLFGSLTSSAAGMASYGAGSKSNLTINGGTFESNVFGNGHTHSFTDANKPQKKNDVTVTINGGTFKKGIFAVQNSEDMAPDEAQKAWLMEMDGSYTLTVNGGKFAADSAFNASYVKGATQLLYKEGALSDAQIKAAKGFKKIEKIAGTVNPTKGNGSDTKTGDKPVQALLTVSGIVMAALIIIALTLKSKKIKS